MSKKNYPDTLICAKVDIGHFKMIADFYERKCPCWSGEFICPCPPFAETKNCRCGAVLPIDEEPKKGETENFKLYRIDFVQLSEIIKKGYTCVGDDSVACLCDDFMEKGVCKFKVFDKID